MVDGVFLKNSTDFFCYGDSPKKTSFYELVWLPFWPGGIKCRPVSQTTDLTRRIEVIGSKYPTHLRFYPRSVGIPSHVY